MGVAAVVFGLLLFGFGTGAGFAGGVGVGVFFEQQGFGVAIDGAGVAGGLYGLAVDGFFGCVA